MPVKPQVQALLDELERQGLPPFDQMSVTQARVAALGFRDLQGEPENVGSRCCEAEHLMLTALLRTDGEVGHLG